MHGAALLMKTYNSNYEPPTPATDMEVPNPLCMDIKDRTIKVQKNRILDIKINSGGTYV